MIYNIYLKRSNIVTNSKKTLKMVHIKNCIFTKDLDYFKTKYSF